jgi:preprotein translocase subunit SecA
MDMMKIQEGEVIQHSMITKSIENAQKKVEENNFAIRKRLLEYDDVMNKQREVIYGRRRNALFGDRMALDLDHMLRDMCASLVEKYAPHSDAEGLQFDCLRYLSIDPEFSHHDFDRIKVPEMTELIYQKARDYYYEKVQFISRTLFDNISKAYEENPDIALVGVNLTDGHRTIPVMVDVKKLLETEGKEVMTQLERSMILQTIDDKWKNHLQAMDDLKQEVNMATIEQKDPLLIYKFEAFNMFQRFLDDINQSVIYFLWKADLAESEEGPMLYSQPQPRQRMAPNPRLTASHPDFVMTLSGGSADEVEFEELGMSREPVTAGGKEVLTAAQRAEMAEQLTALTQRKFNYNLKKASSKNPVKKK